MTTSTSHLFPYYQQELAALRELGRDFAHEYPKVAARLDLGPDVSADPQVERLLESVAFLTARIQRAVDTDFGLLPEALLGILQPHMVTPVPSMAVAQVEADPAQGALSTGYAVPRHTRLYAETDRGQICWFSTCSPLILWPLRCSDTRLTGPEAVAGTLRGQSGGDVMALLERTQAVVQVRLEVSAALPMEALPVRSLRLHCGGDPASAPMLFSLLDARCLGVLRQNGDGSLTPLPGVRLRAAGFADEDAALPDPETAQPAWRLLQELAAFPEKFLFLDVDGLDGALTGRQCDLLFCLSDPPPPGMKVDTGSLRLGCVPVINLFPKTTEPLRLTHDRFEYRLLADARLDDCTEIHTVQSVSASGDRNDAAARLSPLFSCDHAAGGDGPWYLARRVVAERPGITGTDMMLSFVDPALSPLVPDLRTLYAFTLCTNRGLAVDLPGGTRLHVDAALPGLTVRLLRRPTAQLMPPLQGETLWRLVSALSLSHLVLNDDQRSLQALRELLTLVLSPDGDSDFATVIATLEQVEVRRTLLRRPPDLFTPGGFIPGLRVRLRLRASGAADGAAYLLGLVLNHVIGLLAGVNTATQVSLHFAGTAEAGRTEKDWKEWDPRAGTHPLL